METTIDLHNIKFVPVLWVGKHEAFHDVKIPSSIYIQRNKKQHKKTPLLCVVPIVRTGPLESLFYFLASAMATGQGKIHMS